MEIVCVTKSSKALLIFTSTKIVSRTRCIFVQTTVVILHADSRNMHMQISLGMQQQHDANACNVIYMLCRNQNSL